MNSDLSLKEKLMLTVSDGCSREEHSRDDCIVMPPCADCGGRDGEDHGPPDGWQLEDGRIVCNSCCAEDLKRLLQKQPIVVVADLGPQRGPASPGRLRAQQKQLQRLFQEAERFMKVEMRPAYQWTCDACGLDSFEPAMIADFSEEDRLQTAKELGIVDEFAETVPEDMIGDFVTYPMQVECQHCGAKFETMHYSEDIDDA